MNRGVFITVLAGVCLLLSPPSLAAGKLQTSRLCVAAGQAASRATGVPADLMAAIALVESGRRLDGKTAPWPWTINVDGKGYWFATKAKAIAFVRDLRAQGNTSIDVGCYQINLRWHPQAFQSLEDAFDPMANARYAAGFLRSLKPGRREWITVAGAYHSGHEEFAALYRGRVHKALSLSPRQAVAKPVRRRAPGGIELAWYGAKPRAGLLTRATAPLFSISENGNRQ